MRIRQICFNNINPCPLEILFKVEECNEPSCEALIFLYGVVLFIIFFYHMHIALNYKTE